VKRSTHSISPCHAPVLPDPLRRTARYVLNEALDLVDAVAGRRDPLVPKRNRIYIGAGDFRRTGDEFLRYFVELGGLRPTDRVLDVGCGMGRMALALTRYLEPPGRYEGFDIVPEGIAWCTERLAARHPNFHFQLADVHNAHYHPEGRWSPAEYRFPFDDASFDFAFLTSVFTHMRREGLERYVSELARVLAPGGRCLMTFFVIDDESRALVDAGRSPLPMPHGDGVARWTKADDPEAAIGFEERYLRELLVAHGFVLRGKHPGSWCGRASFLSYQDILVAVRA
jgi:SAM-dependent methyltransferase